MATLNDINAIAYPFTKMAFIVTVGAKGTAAFSEVTGIDASVDVIEFRQGNAGSLGLSKIPGLVHHGNITFKMGYTDSNSVIAWAQACVAEHREAIDRQDITVELIDVGSNATAADGVQASGGGNVWTLKHAWVTKLNIPDLDAKTSDVAIATMEVAYEELGFPGGGAAS